MSNEKIVENKKEDSRAFGKFAVIIVVSALIGGVFGFASAFLGEEQKSFSELLIRGLDIISPFAPAVLTTLLVIYDIIQEKKCRKLFAGWDGEEEELVNRIETKLSFIMIATSVNIILVYFFFGAAMYCSNLGAASDKTEALLAIQKAAAGIAGLIYSMVALTLIQKRIVNFEKEINPEKRGSVYDPKFHKTWMESCDEGEKLQIYKSAYKSYQVTNYTCMILWVVTVFGLMSFDFGLLPMTCVVIIWMALSLSYSFETIRLGKYPSEIMK